MNLIPYMVGGAKRIDFAISYPRYIVKLLNDALDLKWSLRPKFIKKKIITEYKMRHQQVSYQNSVAIMVNFDFEGDVENIRPRQLEFISEVLEKQGFKGSQVIVEPVGEAGDNYIADVKRIIVKENGETFKIIAKVSPMNEMTRKMTNTVILFNNESVMYSEVLPKFVQLQRKAGIPEKEIFRYASCYGSFLEAPNEIILLEDLQLSNFTMLDRFQSLTNECMRLILKNFAILHSLSYVLKHTEPETFTVMRSKLNDMWAAMAGNEITTLYLSNLETAALDVSDNDDRKKMLEGCVTEIVQSVVKIRETDADSKYSVIVQGDAWTNNIMFKFKNGTPLQCVFIDYQLSKETSPVCDLLFMIFNCSDHKTRLKYFYDWIDYYYFELDKSLQKYGLNADSAYPRILLNNDLNKYAKPLFGQCVLLANVLTKKSEEAGKVKDTMKRFKENNLAASIGDFTVQDYETQNLFKKRIDDLVDSFLEFRLL